MMGQLPQVPTPEELWKDEKSKYRVWIVLFGLGILAMFALVLVGMILTMINPGSAQHSGSGVKNDIYNYLENQFPDKGGSWWQETTNQWFSRRLVIYPAIKIGFLFIAGMFYIQTVVDSYKRKSFARISVWSTLVISVVAMFGGYEIFQLIWGNKIVLQFSTGIFMFTSYLLSIVIWVTISIPINNIRKTFAVSERVTALKNDPAYQQMMEQAQNMAQNPGMNPGMNPYFNPMSAMQQPVQHKVQPNATPNSNVNTPVQPVELSKDQKRAKELEKLTIVELQQVAKKLSLSGYSSMKKKELIDAIIRVSQDAK